MGSVGETWWHLGFEPGNRVFFPGNMFFVFFFGAFRIEQIWFVPS